jgi:hypothetical protein
MKQPRVGLPLHLQSRSCCPRRSQHQHRWHFITLTLPSPLLASLLFALYHDNIVVAMTMNSNSNGPVPKELTDAQKKKRAKEQAKRKDWRHKEQNGGENANADSQPALDHGVIMKGSRFSDFSIEEPTVPSGAYDPCPSKRYHDIQFTLPKYSSQYVLYIYKASDWDIEKLKPDIRVVHFNPTSNCLSEYPSLADIAVLHHLSSRTVLTS